MTRAIRSTIDTPIARLATVWYPGPADHPPLVLGHGIYLDSTLWDDVVPAVRQDRSVLLIDGPAHGGSDAPDHRWTLTEHTDSIVAVLDHYAIERAVLAGHSWGGMTALRLALRHPDRVTGLGLINTPLTRTRGGTRASFRAQQAMLRLTGSTAFYARQAAAALYDPATLRDRPDLVPAMVAGMTGRRGRDLARTLDAVILDSDDMLHRLEELRMPVAVLAGATDYVLPETTRTAIETALPAATITIARGGHISPHEDPAATAAVLHGLLEQTARL
jgi:3-oxoadipate enol-lactonase/4-carboxymuconolactone decarboxylase